MRVYLCKGKALAIWVKSGRKVGEESTKPPGFTVPHCFYIYNISSDDSAAIQTARAEIYLFTTGTPYKIDSWTLVFAPSGQGFFYSNLPARSHSAFAALGLDPNTTATATEVQAAWRAAMKHRHENVIARNPATANAFPSQVEVQQAYEWLNSGNRWIISAGEWRKQHRDVFFPRLPVGDPGVFEAATPFVIRKKYLLPLLFFYKTYSFKASTPTMPFAHRTLTKRSFVKHTNTSQVPLQYQYVNQPVLAAIRRCQQLTHTDPRTLFYNGSQCQQPVSYPALHCRTSPSLALRVIPFAGSAVGNFQPNPSQPFVRNFLDW